MRVIDSLVAEAYRRSIKGTGRIANALYSGKPVRSVPTTLDGLRWEADPLDWMDQQILTTGSYEPEVSQHLIEVLRPGDVFWDVGANAGVHAVRVKAARPDVSVAAFEPSPTQYARLRHNAAINDVDIAAYCIALADQRGYRQLRVVDVGNSGHNSLHPWSGVAYTSQLLCWCDTVDDLVTGGAPSPNVMKIDVEGGEQAVFAGMVTALAHRQLRHIVFEAPDGAPAVLTDAGFTAARLPSTGGGVDWVASR